MRKGFLFFLLALVSTSFCLELKISLDADSIEYPQWISGTIRVRNNEPRPVVIPLEESLPEFFLTQDTAVKLTNVVDFGPDSSVSLESEVSALWCFMVEIPKDFAKSMSRGSHAISLSMRQFGAEAKSKPFILQLSGTLSDKELSLASMKNLARQLDKDEMSSLNEAARSIAFSRKVQGKVDPRILFWKYRLRHAFYMKDLKQMPVCENCFQMPTTLYWSNLLWDWCRMFYWESPRCAENQAQLQAMHVSRLGRLKFTSSKADVSPVVHTEIGKFVVSQRQLKLLSGGGLRK